MTPHYPGSKSTALLLFCTFIAISIVTAQPAQTPIVMRFGGDCLLAAHYESAAGNNVGKAFEGFDALKTADIAMVNLECPVTTRGQKIPKPFNFRMNPRYLKALLDAGIDIVTIANNHIFDYGKEGLFDTISYLDSVGIRHVGSGRTRQEAEQPVIFDIKGRRVGFIACYGGGEAPTATRSGPGVARRDIGQIASTIQMLKSRDSVDYVVVNIHWGTEKEEFPDASQRMFAHDVIDAGADALIGHHPHVLQGIERYKTGVIVYSLGNFIFGGNNRSTYDTGLFEIRLSGGTVEYEFIPVGVRAWNATLLSGGEATRVMELMSRLSAVFPKSIFTKK